MNVFIPTDSYGILGSWALSEETNIPASMVLTSQQSKKGNKTK